MRRLSDREGIRCFPSWQSRVVDIVTCNVHPLHQSTIQARLIYPLRLNPPYHYPSWLFVVMPRGKDDEDIRDASDDELASTTRGRVNGGRTRTGDTNFEVTRTWDLLDDGGDGSIQGAIDKLYLDSKKRR